MIGRAVDNPTLPHPVREWRQEFLEALIARFDGRAFTPLARSRSDSAAARVVEDAIAEPQDMTWELDF